MVSSFARPVRKKAEEDCRQEDLLSDADHAIEQTEQPQETRCADNEAAWGHRKANHPGKAQMFFGYYVQAATIVREESGPQVPELVRRITLASCKHDPPEQIVPVIERMAKDGTEIGDLIADSGYPYRQPETFAMPMRALGAKLVIDLHPNDRGMKGSHQGAICANGGLYCPATPKALLQLSPLAPGATHEQTADHEVKASSSPATSSHRSAHPTPTVITAWPARRCAASSAARTGPPR